MLVKRLPATLTIISLTLMETLMFGLVGLFSSFMTIGMTGISTGIVGTAILVLFANIFLIIKPIYGVRKIGFLAPIAYNTLFLVVIFFIAYLLRLISPNLVFLNGIIGFITVYCGLFLIGFIHDNTKFRITYNKNKQLDINWVALAIIGGVYELVALPIMNYVLVMHFVDSFILLFGLAGFISGFIGSIVIILAYPLLPKLVIK